MAFGIRGGLGGRRVPRPARAARRAGNAGYGSFDAPSISGSTKVRRGLSILAGALGAWIGLILMMGGTPHVSVSEGSRSRPCLAGLSIAGHETTVRSLKPAVARSSSNHLGNRHSSFRKSGFALLGAAGVT